VPSSHEKRALLGAVVGAPVRAAGHVAGGAARLTGEGIRRTAYGIGGGTLGAGIVAGGMGAGTAQAMSAVPEQINNTYNGIRHAQKAEELAAKLGGSMVQVPDAAYVAHARGHLQENDLAHLEDFAQTLQKEAFFGSMSPDIKKAIQTGLIGAGASAAVGLAGIAAAKGVNKLTDVMTFESDLQQILRVRPELSQYPKEEIRLVYRSLRMLNPEFSKDPLVASTFLMRQLRERSSENPGGAPMLELGVAKDLSQASQFLGQRRNAVRDAMVQAGQAGASMGADRYMHELREQSGDRRDLETQAFQTNRDQAGREFTREQNLSMHTLKAQHENARDLASRQFATDNRREDRTHSLRDKNTELMNRLALRNTGKDDSASISRGRTTVTPFVSELHR